MASDGDGAMILAAPGRQQTVPDPEDVATLRPAASAGRLYRSHIIPIGSLADAAGGVAEEWRRGGRSEVKAGEESSTLLRKRSAQINSWGTDFRIQRQRDTRRYDLQARMLRRGLCSTRGPTSLRESSKKSELAELFQTYFSVRQSKSDRLRPEAPTPGAPRARRLSET